MRRFMLLLTAAALVAAACTRGGAPEEATPTRSPSPSVSPTPELSPVALPVGMVAFAAEVPSVPLLHPDEPPYAGPPTPRSLDGVAVAPSVAEVLRDPAVSDALTGNGFVVVPSDLRLFHFAYQGNLY